MNYNDIIEGILEKEGGYVSHPSDRGGPTNFGITELVAKDWGYQGDMKDFPESMARTIYSSIYIYKPNFHLIGHIDENLAEMIIDFGVHAGPYRAGKCLQRALNLTTSKKLTLVT